MSLSDQSLADQITEMAVCRACNEMVSLTGSKEYDKLYVCEGGCGHLGEDDVQHVYPCARCGWRWTCGDPPGEDCHS